MTLGKLLQEAVDDRTHPTPYVVLDLDEVGRLYRRFAAALPSAEVCYAVKANSEHSVLARLVAEGAGFDVASIGEVRQALAAGAAPGSLSYGNTVKRPADIVEAHEAGVTVFSFDSREELEKIAGCAPGGSVFTRLAVDPTGAGWPLDRKFGCGVDEAASLLERAGSLGLDPIGVSFHVGSQQTDPKAWIRAMSVAAEVFAKAAARGVSLRLVDAGGGFPGYDYAKTAADPPPPIEDFGSAIEGALDDRFPQGTRLLVEPGRYLVSDAGWLVTEVILDADRDVGGHRERWVFIDAGYYQGLAEGVHGAVRYQLLMARADSRRPGSAAFVAGPSCDSLDAMSTDPPTILPWPLEVGERLVVPSTGSYIGSVASVAFNGFPPPHVVTVGGSPTA